MFHAGRKPRQEGCIGHTTNKGRNSMKRRDFLKVTGIGAAGAATLAAPAIAQSMPEIKWRMTTSWPKSLDTLYGGAEMMAKVVAEATDNKFQIQTFAGRRNRSRPAGARCRAERHRRDGTYRVLLLFRQGSDFHLRLVGAVRTQRAPQPGLVHAGRRQGAAQRVLQELQRHLAAGRQHRLPDGRLVPQGDQHRRRSEGPEDSASAALPAA